MGKYEARRVLVAGITQGVGFRPFVYRLAKRYGLRGYVLNMGGAEVEIFVEGGRAEIERFLADLRERKPPPAEIEDIIVEAGKPRGFSDFRILPSKRSSKLFSQIPPDFAICEHCLREILDPSSRHYMYAFNSCAWCGPRFSMMFSVPYDRKNTYMIDFPLCEDCRAEYDDPDNERRFHAQGISCPKCGPRMWVLDGDGEMLEAKDPIRLAAALIDEGSIVAIKGIGGFHIAALATNDDVVLTLRKRKRRPYKPFAIMAIDTDIAKRIVHVSDVAERILLSPRRPIVLLPERDDSPVSRYVAPGLDMQGVMIAYSGIHYLLLMNTDDKFLIMTSGNRKGKPICRDVREALKELRGVADYFLVHNRRIINRVDDSVVRLTRGRPVLLRRSRGYAPQWIRIPVSSERPVIAFGAELQNAGAVCFSDRAILTQYVGDMDEYSNLLFLEEALGFLVDVYRVEVSKSIIVADMHPRYNSRRLAEEWSKRHGSELVLVQHHRAHIASVLAESGIELDERIVGIAIDGVGYGDDGAIWGGEVFYGSIRDLQRVGHLQYHPMPGGDLATRYPVRMLVGILSTFLDDWEVERIIRRRGLMRGLRSERELSIALMQARRVNCEKTSSIGRVLDSVSAFLGLCFERTYEGEPAMRLEAHARGGALLDDLEVGISSGGGTWVVRTRDIFEYLLENDSDSHSLARTVQYSLGYALGKIASKCLTSASIQSVFVSGGAAVNDYIVWGIEDGAEAEVIVNSKVPPGDGGIALGQVYLAVIRG